MPLTQVQIDALNDWSLSDPALKKGTLAGVDALNMGDLLNQSLSSETLITGVFNWVGATIASATEINVIEGTGLIVDSVTDPAVVTSKPISWAPAPTFTVLTPNGIGFQQIFVDSLGNIQQQSTALSAEQLRDNILLCEVGYEANVVISITLKPRILQSIGTILNDFIDFLPDASKLKGAIVSDVTGQLQVFRDTGKFFSQGRNHFTNSKDPNVSTIAADGNVSTPLLYNVVLSDETVDSTDVATFPKEVEVAGTPTALTGTQATIHYLFTVPGGNVLQMGQTTYSTAVVAFLAADTDFFNFDFADGFQGAVLLAQIIVGNSASDFSDPDLARIINKRLTGIAGTGLTSLQGAYTNSVDPEITTDTTRGALTIKRGSAADTDDVLEILSGSGANVASINGLGNLAYAGQFSNGVNTLADSANIVTNCDFGNVHTVTLTANRILDTFTNVKAGAVYYIIIKQDATGGHTLDVTAFKTIGGVDPVLSTAANAIDIYTFLSDGTDIFLIETQDFS